jgi:hypothetical protein
MQMNEANPGASADSTIEGPSASAEQLVLSLLKRTPEFIPLLNAAAAWLARLAAQAGTQAISAAPPAEDQIGSADDAHAGNWGNRSSSGVAEDLPGPVEPPPSDEAMRALFNKFGGPSVAPRIAAPADPGRVAGVAPADPDAELDRLRAHVGLQQAAIKWRQSKERQGFAAVKDTYAQLCDRGKEDRCFMWALDQAVESVGSDELDGIREWYVVLGEALDAYLDEESELPRSARLFEHLAMAMQATKRAIGTIASLGLRDEGLEELRRWMRRNAPRFDVDAESLSRIGETPFADVGAARRALEELRSESERRAKRARDQRSARNRFIYELKRFFEDPAEAEQHVRGMSRALDELHAAGGAVTQRDFVTQVGEVLGNAGLPSALLERSDGMALAMAMAERHEQLTDDADGESPAMPAEVMKVREVLRGRTVVMVGGDERPQHRKAIEDAFELRELRWVATRPHETHANIVPALTRDDVDLVLLLIRWASHSYSELRNECERCDTPFVRVPGGYNPRAIAHEVLKQVGQRFGCEP